MICKPRFGFRKYLLSAHHLLRTRGRLAAQYLQLNIADALTNELNSLRNSSLIERFMNCSKSGVINELHKLNRGHRPYDKMHRPSNLPQRLQNYSQKLSALQLEMNLSGYLYQSLP